MNSDGAESQSCPAHCQFLLRGMPDEDFYIQYVLCSLESSAYCNFQGEQWIKAGIH